MIKRTMIIFVLLLTACSSSSQKIYYQLPSFIVEQSSKSSTLQCQLWVKHVIVDDYLSGSGLVYQTNDVRYVIAADHLWASPLDQQLQQTLVENLSMAMPGWRVSAKPMDNCHQTILNVTVSGFHGRYDGNTVVRGEWILDHQGRMIHHPFNIILPQLEDGYDALVRTLANGWQQEAKAIATQVAALY